MCLVFDARDSTKDIDAQCRPSSEIRDAVIKVAAKEGVSDHWLNDAVKGFLSDRGSFVPFLELSNLTVLAADARYMLAMKCLAMRLGEGYRDEDDVRYLLTNLGIESYEDALEVISHYYPLQEFKDTSLAVLRELTQSRQ